MFKKICLFVKENKILYGISVALMIIFFIFKFEIRTDILEKRFSNINYLGEVGTWGYLGDDVVTTVKDMLPVNQKDMQKNIDEFVKSREVEPYKGFRKSIQNKNIVLIQLEGIDAISLDLKVNDKYVMPNLNMLKQEGVYINNAYDESGSGRTSDGEFLALTSLLPVANESMYIQYSLNNVVTLPKILAENGYETVSIHGFDGSFYNRRSIHQQLGYEESYFLEDLESEAEETDYLGWGLSDEYILNKVGEIIESSDQKLFIHAITLTNHHPFDAATGAYEDVLFNQPGNIVEYYLNSIRYTDLVIGKFIQNLENINVMEDTLLVIFSDHDSGITKEIYEYFDMEYDGDSFQYDKIPVLFYDGVNRREENMISGQADIMPMILSYLDLNIPQSSMGLNYIGGNKVVYKQSYTIVGSKEIAHNEFDMDQITRGFVKLRSK